MKRFLKIVLAVMLTVAIWLGMEVLRFRYMNKGIAAFKDDKFLEAREYLRVPAFSVTIRRNIFLLSRMYTVWELKRTKSEPCNCYRPMEAREALSQISRFVLRPILEMVGGMHPSLTPLARNSGWKLQKLTVVQKLLRY